MKKYILLAALFLTGCGPAISTTDPDANFSAVRMRPMSDGSYMISCVDSDSYCTQLAGNICGAYTQKRAWGNADAWGGRRTMIVRCKE